MKLNFSSIINLFLISAVLGSGFGYSQLYLFHIVLLLLVVTWFYYDFYGTKRFFVKPTSPSWYFFLLMFSWYTIGLAWSIQPLYTLRYLIYLLFGLSIVFVILGRATTEERYQSVYELFKVCFLVETAVALLEAFTSFRLPTSPYSDYAELFGRKATDFALFGDEAVLYIKAAPTGFHGNPNNLAVAMATILPFYLFSKKNSIKILGSLAILLVIIMTGSRGSFLGAMTGIALFLAITNFRRFLLLLFCGAIAFSTLVTCLDTLKASENNRVAEFATITDVLITYLSEDDVSGGSISLRQELIRNGLDALDRTHGLGVGGGGSVAVQERVGGVGGKLTSMHNFWVETLVDSGVLFFALFVGWYLVTAFFLLFIYLKTDCSFFKYHAGALFVSYTIFSIACISASSVIYHLPMWIMFGMAAALMNVWAGSRQAEVKMEPSANA